MNDLGYVRSAHAGCPICSLTSRNKVGLDLHRKLKKKYDKCDPRRLEEIVTGDETWICHFQPDSKAKKKVWVSSEGDRPVMTHRCKTSNRMLYAIFFDSKGPVLQILVPKGSSVTGKFYRETQTAHRCPRHQITP